MYDVIILFSFFPQRQQKPKNDRKDANPKAKTLYPKDDGH